MPEERQPRAYIRESKPYGTLYFGVTSNLIARTNGKEKGKVQESPPTRALPPCSAAMNR